MSENTYLPNLAGSDESDKVCTQELEAAGITVVALPECARKGETKTCIMGEVGHWSFTRAWRYWVAEGPGLPVEAAEILHEQHGKEVRVDGHCGCPSPREWFKGFGVGLYHIDTQEGLTALAQALAKVS